MNPEYDEQPPTPSVSRRSFLHGAAALGATGVAATMAPGLVGRAEAAAPRPRAGSISNIVIAMQENRAFDHYYGYAPFVGSYGVPAGWTNPDGHGGTVAPYHLQSQTAGSLSEPNHEWAAIHSEVDGGKMDGFVTTNGKLALGYYDASDISYYYTLAQQYTLCVNYYCGLLGPTNPNRLHLIAGTSGGNTSNSFFNIIFGQGYLTFPCLFDLLDQHGITWKIYNGFGAITSGFNFASYFTRWANDPRANVDDDVYFKDLAGGTLPQVSFICPNALYCEHPPAPISWGVSYISQRLHALQTSAYWPSAAFVYTYDECGGFFDNVAPPQIPIAPGGIPQPGVLDQYGPGLRVPTIVVSPYTAGGGLATNQYDHSSVLKLVETVFKLPTLASINHQFDTRTPGKNNAAAHGKKYGPPAPPRDANPALGNLFELFNFGRSVADAPIIPALPTPRDAPRDRASAERFARGLSRE